MNDNINYLTQKQKENTKLKSWLIKAINISQEHKKELEILYKYIGIYESLLKKLLKTDSVGLQEKINQVQEEFKNEIDKFKDMTAQKQEPKIF